MISLDVDAIERDAAMRSCECGEDAKHFRACSDCKFTVARCEACGGNKSASREMHLHRQREHGAQLQILGCETPQDPVLEMRRPIKRGDCSPCPVCQAAFDSGELDEMPAGMALACGHFAQDAANHCRPCPWVGCRHHALIEIAASSASDVPRANARRECSVDGCRELSHARGLCKKHYANAQRTGEPEPQLYNIRPKDRDDPKSDARPTTIRLNKAPPTSEDGVRRFGRRTGLHAQDTVEVVQHWIERAVDRLVEMPDSCSLDVADRGGVQLVEVANLLGVTTATIKDEVGPAGERLRAGLAEWKDHVPEDHTSNLAAMQDNA